MIAHDSTVQTAESIDGAETQAAQVTEQLRSAIHQQFGRSLHIRTLDTGSCGACESDMRMLTSPHYDMHRLGLFFTPAPRHADLLMVTGPAVRAMDDAVRKTFEAIPDPKVVVAVGACALGGVYPKDEFVHGSVDAVLPVDVWIPGCPPSPLALLQGLLVAVGRLADRVAELDFIGRGPIGPDSVGADSIGADSIGADSIGADSIGADSVDPDSVNPRAVDS